MQPYGLRKRHGKIHPHNECGICSENNIVKKSARQRASKEIQEDLEETMEEESQNP